MQKNDVLPDFQTANPFSEHFETFGKSRLFDRLHQKFQPKPYHVQFRTLRAVVLGASFLFHILSAATAAALIFLFISSLIPSAMGAAVVTLAALAGLEISKRETSGRFFHDALQFGKYSPGLLAVVLGLAAVSTTCSYFGAERAVKAFTPLPALISADTLTAPIRTQIASIDAQISDAKRNTWKGKLTPRAARTVERLTRQREALTNEMIRQHGRADTRNDATEKTHTSTTEANAKGFALFTLCCEVLLVLCLWYLQFYDYRSFTEFCRQPVGKKADAHTIQAGGLAAEMLGTSNGNGIHGEAPARRPIGFHRPADEGNGMRYRARDNGMGYDASAAAAVVEVDRSLKPCAHCGELFRYRTTWQKFCTEGCKLAYHEARHGRPFDPTYKKKAKPT